MQHTLLLSIKNSIHLETVYNPFVFCHTESIEIIIESGDLSMREDTVKLMRECSSGCKMAINSLDQVREFAEDETLRHLLDQYDKKHKELEEEIAKELGIYGEEEKEPGMAASVFSWITTEMKLMLEDGSGKIAALLMDGCNMGIKSVGKYLNQYKDAETQAVELARKLLQTEEEMQKDLQKYL